MTAYAETVSVGITLTPSVGGAAALAGGVAVGALFSPIVGGVHYGTYTDENGTKQPWELEEWYKGRTVEQNGTTIKYTRIFHIIGTFEPTDCLDIGPQIGDLDDVLPTFVVQNRKLYMYAKGGGASNIVRLEVDYQQPSTPQSSGGDAEATCSLEFESETEHVDLALSQTHYGVVPPVGEDLLVNFDGTTVNGVDIDAPVTMLTEDHTFTESEFSPSFRAALAANVKKVNLDIWRGYEAESVLFDGASATKRGKRWYVSFRFRIRVGFTNKPFSIVNQAGAAQAESVTKKGWDYIWFSMTKQPILANTKVQIAPTSIHVAKVYDTLDFETLGIGILPMN